ncbi:hypothetical protein BH09ACT5_BH09ACT5_00160 [soil metagenome]
MPVLGNRSRDRVDRIAAAVGGVAFLAGIAAMAVGALAPASADPPSTVTTTVVSSPVPGDPVTQTVTTTEPPTRATLPPRITEEVTVTEGAAPGSVVVTTAPAVASVDQPFLGSTVAVVAVQLLLITLTALLLAFATQRVLLGEYWIRRASVAGVRGHPIDESEAKAVKHDIVSATEAPDLSRPLFERSGVADARLRLLQSRIALELEVRRLAQDNDVPASLSIPSVVRGLVEKKKMSPKLAAGITSLNELGDRLGSGAEITPDATTLLTESYAQALAKIGGKIKRGS